MPLEINIDKDLQKSSLTFVLKLATQVLKVPYSTVAFIQDDQSWNEVFYGSLDPFYQNGSTFFLKIISSDVPVAFENAIGFKLNHHAGVFCVVDEHSRTFTHSEQELIHSFKSQIELILDQNRFHALLEKQNEIISQNTRLATLGQMASEVVHEINTPMSTIQIRIALILKQAQSKKLNHDDIAEFLEYLYISTDRICQIINGIKSFSKSSNHDSFEKINVSELIEYSISFCLDSLKKTKIEFIRDYNYSKFKVNCRAVQISQVIINLVNNAVDAILESDDPWLKISLIDTGENIEIRILDSGKGIDEKHSAEIFNPFFTTKGSTSGTGLGLSISKSIIELHEGTIQYQKINGHTAFVISLPKAP